MTEEDSILAERLAQMSRFTERWKKDQAERKAREHGIAIPGLDVPWWNDSKNEPTRVWQHQGIYCALMPGAPYMGPTFNGYAMLPKGHPWQWVDLQMDGGGPEVHGGITFGPHVTGWIGFDTAHAGDHWPLSEAIRIKEMGLLPEALWEEWLEYRAKTMAPHPQRDGSEMPGWDPWEEDRPRPSWGVTWTLELLLNEIEDLARQVKEAML